MRLSRIRNLVFAGSLGVLLLRAAAQQPEPAAPAESTAPAPPATGDPNLFPTAPPPGAPVPDFSGTSTAPASAFGTPDFSGSSVSGSAAPSFSGGAAGKPGAAAPAGAPAGGAPSGGFLPGPFSSPASTTPTTPNGVAAPASVFGTTTLGSGTGLGAGAGTGTAGLGGANTRTPVPSTPTSFTLPGAYGQAPLTFSVGQGRLARPRYVWTTTAQLGYDDNVLQTPTAQRGQPAVTTLVQTQAEIPDQTVQVVVQPTGRVPIGVRPTNIQTVVIPGQPAKFEKVVVTPGVTPQERIGSVVARTGVGFEMQLSNSRSVFTADAHVNYDYYFDRPGDHGDFNGNVAIIYAHRYSSRLQFSANVSAAYLSQPDLRVVSGPTREVGDYLSYSSKFDLTYQWAKHFSTVTSLTLGLLNFMNAVQQLNDNYTAQIGTEARYSWSNRLTTVEEIRLQEVKYPNGPTRDSHSFFVLIGADYAYSRRLSGTIRLGESIRTFEAGGDSKSSPYLELTASYRFSQTGTINLSSRYGFEEPQDATSEVVVFRTSLSAVQAFTARLRGSLSAGYIHSSTTSNSAGGVNDITGDTLTVDLGLDYALTRKFSLSASYSFVNDLSSLESIGYYRNQLFLGAQYTF